MRISDWSSDVCSSDLVDGALNVEAVGAQAVLPGGGELRLHRLVHGAAEVGVGKTDEGGVAAELQAQALDARRALRIEQPADLRRAGEGERAHAGVGGPGADDGRRRAARHVDRKSVV